MEQIKPKKRMNLTEWIASMKKVVNKPKVNHIYLCEDNLYLRYEIPKGQENAGHHRWYRLSAVDVLAMYFDETSGQQPYKAWLAGFNKQRVNRKSCDD